jgi:hypothetical protein
VGVYGVAYLIGIVDLNKPGCKLPHRTKLKSSDEEHLTSKQKIEWHKELINEYPSKKIKIDLVNYNMSHMSTSEAEKIYVNEIILKSNPLIDLIFHTCHELGHPFGDKKVMLHDLAVEAEEDFFAGSCLSNFKWNMKLKPYINLYQTKDYDRYGNDIHCQKMVEIIQQSYSSLLGVTIAPDKALHEKFLNGVDTAYPGPNCRELSALSGLLEVGSPFCWYNP